MSGLSLRGTLLPKRGATALLLTALGAALLAGCGGGGGNGNSGGTNNSSGVNSGTNNGTNNGGTTGNASIIGRVMDTQGQGVPGVNINIDSGGVIATTLNQGGYRVDNLTGNVVHRVTAAATRQDGTVYTGSTQVFTQSGLLVSNANILLSPSNRQASVSGVVQDSNGNAFAGVRVALALPNNGNYSSLIAYSDSSGAYTISNVPIDLPSASAIAITASVGPTGSQAFQNQSATLNGLQAGGAYTQNFQLNALPVQSLTAPSIVAVTSSTEPTDSLSGSARRAYVAQTSLYEHLRRLLSPAYARMATRHSAVRTRRVVHATGSPYAVETDLAFDNTTQLAGSSVLAYNVYRTTGTLSQNPPVQTPQPYDVLQDPLANFYTDLTFSSDSLASSPVFAYSQYNYAVSVLGPDNADSGLSSAFSIVPLGPLTLTQPTTGQLLANNVTLTWNLVNGATKYFVFVYDQYPSAAISPSYATPSGTSLPGNVTSFTLPGPLLGGRAYYAVVVGANDQPETTDSVTGQPVSISNAAVTFSQITRFFVP